MAGIVNDNSNNKMLLHECLKDLSRGMSAQVILARSALKGSSDQHLELCVDLLAQAVETFSVKIGRHQEQAMDQDLKAADLSETPTTRTSQAAATEDSQDGYTIALPKDISGHLLKEPSTMSGLPSRLPSKVPSFTSPSCITTDWDCGDHMLWPFWHQELVKSPVKSPSGKIRRMNSSVNAEALQRRLSTKEETNRFGSANLGRNGLIRWMMIRPGSTRQYIWDCLNVIFIAYDLLSLPLMAFDYDQMEWTEALRLGTSCFWTGDFIANFLQGYHVNGVVEMRPRFVACRYVKQWFAVDLFLLLLDWFLILSQVESGFASIARIGKTGRFLRVLRLARIVRLAKFNVAVRRLTDAIFNARTVALVMILKLLFLLGTVCHFVGCAWYAVGTVGYEDNLSSTWVGPLAAQGAGTVHRYLASFHWAFAQFTPSSTPYSPITLREEFFNVGLLGFGFVIFTASLGSITSTIQQMQKASVEKDREKSFLLAYLSQRHISWDLGQQVLTFLRQNRRQKRQEILECDVGLVALLPDNLVKALRTEAFAPVITKHPIFQHLLYKHPAALQDISHKVALQKIYRAGEEVFAYGEDIRGLYFVFSGMFEYSPTAEEVVVKEEYGPGRWIGEAGLWIQCEHGGPFTAKLSSSTLELDAERLFKTLAEQHVDALETLQNYARSFAAKVRETEEQENQSKDAWEEWKATFEEFGGFDTLSDEHLVNDVFGTGTPDDLLVDSLRTAGHRRWSNSTFISTLFMRH